VFSYKLSENAEVRLLEERHAQQLTDLTDRNREHLREWLPWVDTNRTVEELTTTHVLQPGRYGSVRSGLRICSA
jgi:hypothetical protein